MGKLSQIQIEVIKEMAGGKKLFKTITHAYLQLSKISVKVSTFHVLKNNQFIKPKYKKFRINSLYGVEYVLTKEGKEVAKKIN